MIQQIGTGRPRCFSLGMRDLTPEQKLPQNQNGRTTTLVLPTGEVVDGTLGYLGFDQFRFLETGPTRAREG